jgi:uncharacterized protein YkwD
MKYLLILLLLNTGIVMAQKVQTMNLESYLKLNNEETRLEEFKDNEATLALKLKHLAVINQSRAKNKVQPVDLDIFASRVANKMAKEAADNSYMGHFNMEGQTPYMRYGLAGGNDHVTENAGAISNPTPIDNSDESLLKYMAQIHQMFMNEKAPNDGHKKNCIAPQHNYVGIGLAVNKGELRYYEEFLDRYLTFSDIPRQVKAGATVSFDAKPLSSAFHLFALIIYQEGHPRPLKPRTISAIPSYKDYTPTVFMNLAPWDLPPLGSNGEMKFDIAFPKKGYYYLQFFVDDKPLKKGKASTDGKTCASGIVIAVE